MLSHRLLNISGMISVTLVCLLGGCLITHHSDTKRDGTRVAPDTFAQIKPGSTTIGWVGATLGPPTSKSRNDNDEVWRYVYTEHTDEGGAIFLIFGGNDTSEKTETAFIEFKDGIVINKWRG